MSRLVKQQTLGREGTELWGIETEAANEFVARQKARAFARRLEPGIRNVITPEVTDKEPIQTTFNDLFPETLRRERYVVEFVVVR